MEEMMEEAYSEAVEADKKLQEKILKECAGRVVRKDLAFQVKNNLAVPTFVLEYLLAQYCTSADEDVVEKGKQKVKDIVIDNYVNRAECEIVKSRIREKGTYIVIDKVSAALDEGADAYFCSLENIQLFNLFLDEKYVKGNEKLLSGTGVWCIVTLRYNSGDDVVNRYEIEKFRPIQIPDVDVDEYAEMRGKFTEDEWIDFILHTIGLNPCVMNRREKFIALARLLPYVETNFAFVELGPKGTGKSHVFQEFSPYGVLVSGGDVTSPRLFVKITGNKERLGLVAYWDNVAWDEFEQQKGRATDAVLIDTMQNYLANKAFNRGAGPHEAQASLCFVGNTKHNVPYMMRHTHLFESIPTGFIKGAFLDRIHLYNPGWEMSPLKKSSFSRGYGLITDYIAAILHKLRLVDRSDDMNKYVKFSPTLSARDHAAIRKTCSGMIKLLYPDGNYTEQQLLEIVDFAAEGRKRVKEQLYKIDETFRAEPAVFEYTVLSSGETRQVKTLEEIEHESADVGEVAMFAKGGESEAAGVPAKAGETVAAGVASGSPAGATWEFDSAERPKLGPKHVHVKENQRGISYKALFGDYLKGAQEIVIIDPYIHKPHQIENLTDLLQLIVDLNADSEEDMSVALHTTVNEKEPTLQEGAFKLLKEDLEREGVAFDYTYDASHDRAILVDDTWAISLGRGLDIFDYFQRFSLKHASQRMRKCRDFQMTIAPLQPMTDTDALIAGVKSGALKSKSVDGYLVLAGEFYDQIEAGTKTVEYRDFTAHNLKRTIGITTIRFNRGYGHPGLPPAQMRWEVEKVAFQDAANNECDPLAIPDGFVPVRIAIHLGKRL